MPEGITAESLVNDIVETISEGGVSKHKEVPFFVADDAKYVKNQYKRLFGRDKPVYNVLGGGKPADLLLWRNKKISAGALACATVVWAVFEWLDYHFLTLVSFVLVLGLLVQFVWGLVYRSRSSVPRVAVPEEYFVKVGRVAGREVNRGLNFLQDVSTGGNAKQFLLANTYICLLFLRSWYRQVVAGLWAAAIIGSWCNFLTLIYIGFVAAHTLPAVYEQYEDEVDGFVDSVLGQLKHNYGKLDSGVFSRIP
ncbi:hypothetical protein M569_01531, partial [Genlisea aurea]